MALGDEDGTGELNVASNTASSSLLPMSGTHHRAAQDVLVVGTETVEIRRLDSLGIAFDTPAFLKLDVQGYEDRVLAGAREGLRHVMLIECEVSVVPGYESQLGLHEMLDLFAGLGFRLRALEPAGRDRSGSVWFFNAFLERAAEGE
jgi:hypothetical protein